MSANDALVTCSEAAAPAIPSRPRADVEPDRSTPTWLRKALRTAVRAVTDTDARQGIVALLDQGVASATNFLTTVIIGRAATSDQLGVYALGLSVVVFTLSMQGALICSPYTIFCKRCSTGQRARYAGSALIQQLGLSMLAVTGMAACGLVLLAGAATGPYAALAWTLAAVVPFVLAREFVRRVALAHLKIGCVLVLDLGSFVLRIGGLMALAGWGALTAQSALAVMGVACAAAAAVTLFAVRRWFASPRGRVPFDLVRNWGFGKWVFAGQLALVASGYLIPWMVALVAGTRAAGVYVACSSIVFLVNPVTLGISNLLSPRAAEAYAEGGMDALRRVSRKAALALAAIVGSLAAALCLVGGRIAVVLYGEPYAGNRHVIAVLAVSAAVFAVGVSIDTALWAMEMAQTNFRANLAGLAVMLACGLGLIWSWGLLGAAVAGLAGTVTTFFIKQLALAAAYRAQAAEAAQP